MARAKIINQLEGDNLFLVEDDLGVRHELTSAVDGYAYEAGSWYRIFVPDGEYRPAKFRLLPYKTSRRWAALSVVAASKPASAAAIYLQGDKFLTGQPQDYSGVVAEVMTGEVKLVGGGCAAVAEHGIYEKGDCVAVIHDKKVAGDADCLTIENGKPWVAGFGCDQPPKKQCAGLVEDWFRYSEDISLATGSANMEKSFPQSGEIKRWQAKVSKGYMNRYGIAVPNVVDVVGGTLNMVAGWQPISVSHPVEQNYPEPTRFYEGGLSTRFSLPPLIVTTRMKKKLSCGNALHMRVNLAIRDIHHHYPAVSSALYGKQIPGCLLLTFDDSPYPNHITADKLRSGDTVWQGNMDKQFTLLYTTPGADDFSGLRTSTAWGGGQYGMYRPSPLRLADGSLRPLSSRMSGDHRSFNVPMDDPENGFSPTPSLISRVFNAQGVDVTPALPTSDVAGIYPGYFEIISGATTSRNLKDDFLAAYPFMTSGKMNPSGELPALKSMSFYLQSKVSWYQPSSVYIGNDSSLACQHLELYYV